ncbi:CaiB/BaiF CoA-transferase family protein [Solwaraspora sp. WMMD1047]|uniref:CaiB/BaiF CoA transferase family protein n=1 Tax=Solwaraspora sp. WMMD1047 TaxID=3016102 RepID=UPI002415F7B8|nr:CaiB/BaiF CoA-transferase family protein [Solwaraspora sp. WMMD1047]MDG4831778.1 CaiB/BaiF CoA-transferase family protein [Solwaraspora sp. WMMD1047]
MSSSGAGAAARGPLGGLRVVELAGLGPAPFAAMLLADLGADVVRVDRVDPVFRLPADPRVDLLNRGKRSIAVDLKQPAGAEVVLALAERADVLIEGWRPGVAERLGVGPAEVLARNPALVYGRMTGWGQDGPLAGTAGHDIDYIAVAGALHPIGRAGGPPQIPLNLVGDFGGGALYLVVGVLAALREAERSGRGQVVDAAIVDGVAHLTTMISGLLAGGAWRDTRGGNLLDSGTPFYDVYRTADDEHMAVGALEPKFYAEFLRLLGLADAVAPDDQYDPAGWPALRTRIAAAFAGRTRAEWTDVFAGSDACVSPVLALTEAPDHPHLAARGTYVDRDGVRQPAAAPRFSATPTAPGGAPPLPGEHSRAVLADWAVADAESWLATGAVVTHHD